MAKWWEYWIPGYGAYAIGRDMIKGGFSFKNAADIAATAFTGKSISERQEENQENSAVQLQQALDHAEEREDTAIQRRVDDLQAAGINPVLAGTSFGAAESGAAQTAVNSEAQKQQAQAAQTQALSSLISSAAMLFMAKGRGIPVTTTGGTSAAAVDLLANGKGLTKAEKHAIDTYKMYHKY